MEKENKKFTFMELFTIFLLLCSLIFIIIGITYSIYTKFLLGSTSNIITTGNISFAYTEGDFIGNGIKLYDAFPISDIEGKKLYGENKYFDFSVNGNTNISDVNYEIVVQKLDNSDMNDRFAKIYLTEIENNEEIVSPLVIDNDKVVTYDELHDSTRQKGKVVYLGTMKNNTANYSKKFRLRMWISDNATLDDVYTKQFSVKVNVVGY